jgi:hypothetical protein
MTSGDYVTVQTVDLRGPGPDVTTGLAALEGALKGRYLRSVELLPGREGWVRVTFNDQTTLDLPGVCLMPLDASASAEIPQPRLSRSAARRVVVTARQ